MPAAHKTFLISFVRGKPDWTSIELPGAANLPAVKWRQLNLDKLTAEKRATEVASLEKNPFALTGKATSEPSAYWRQRAIDHRCDEKRSNTSSSGSLSSRLYRYSFSSNRSVTAKSYCSAKIVISRTGSGNHTPAASSTPARPSTIMSWRLARESAGIATGGPDVRKNTPVLNAGLLARDHRI
jgi:hypothetical protein